MGEETPSRIVLGGLLVLFLLVRFFFTVKSRKEGGKSPGGGHTIAREGRANFFIRRLVIAPALSAFVFLYYMNPSWIRSFSIPMPQWGIYAGAVLGLCGITLLIWVHLCLGKEWSASLQVRKDHHLIRTGPYSRIRHPMYTALFTIYFSMGIVSSTMLY